MPSTVTSARAAVFAASFVSVTSNSRVMTAAASASTSPAVSCTFVDSGGSRPRPRRAAGSVRDSPERSWGFCTSR